VHYQEKIDKIFGKGSLWKHRTLRTLFDPNSSEYNQTTMDKKLEILNTIRENEIDLTELLNNYKEFYTEENKIHVVDVADEGLEILLKQETK
jgi:DNA-binding transcriptional ArsR family regulator